MHFLHCFRVAKLWKPHWNQLDFDLSRKKLNTYLGAIPVTSWRGRRSLSVPIALAASIVYV